MADQSTPVDFVRSPCVRVCTLDRKKRLCLGCWRTAEEIAEFCSATYGVTFPMTEKIEVNGEQRHPLYERLVGVPDAEGYTGDIRWNFEKFLVAPGGQVTARFSPQVTPEDPELVAAVESTLPR